MLQSWQPVQATFPGGSCSEQDALTQRGCSCKESSAGSSQTHGGVTSALCMHFKRWTTASLPLFASLLQEYPRSGTLKEFLWVCEPVGVLQQGSNSAELPTGPSLEQSPSQGAPAAHAVLSAVPPPLRHPSCTESDFFSWLWRHLLKFNIVALGPFIGTWSFWKWSTYQCYFPGKIF